jgi:hypothetical protein
LGTLLVLLDEGVSEPVLDERARGQLARLGITTVSLLADARTLGIVLDGWAFDPARSADDARAVIVGPQGGARVLRPVQTAVTRPATKEATHE